MTRLSFPWLLSLFLLVRLLSANYNLIHDADETFNYLEPLHFLLHGTGFETWEYSPTYAIRSWTYILLFSLPIRAASFTIPLDPVHEFYLLRVVLGAVSAVIESWFVTIVQKETGTRVAFVVGVGLLGSCGLFNASTAFLPSSFTMYTSTLALGYALQRRYFWATISIGVGVVVGWPFTGLLILPIVLLSFLEIRSRTEATSLILRYVYAGAVLVGVLGLTILVDWWFYQIWTIVPLNIVLYNVFSSRDGRGPDLFGVEPTSYYFLNLLLNFNILFPLSMLGLPMALARRKMAMVKGSLGYLIWFVVFCSQAHKEERFMYPIYPLLILSAAITIDSTFLLILHPLLRRLFSRPRALGQTILVFTLILTCGASGYRITSMVNSYSAPLHFFPNLPEGQYCLGSDWYRFPTSFLLPPNVTIEFMRSDFTGLLPGKFTTSWDVPEGMNDRNEYSPDKAIEEAECECIIYWSPVPGLGATRFVDRETGVKKEGYYSYRCGGDYAGRLNRLGLDLLGRKLDEDGMRFSDAILA